MYTTTIFTLALPLALNVLPIQALSTPKREKFRSIKFEARNIPHTRSLQTRQAGQAIINVTDESDLQVRYIVWGHIFHGIDFISKVYDGSLRWRAESVITKNLAHLSLTIFLELKLAVDTGSSDLWVHTPNKLTTTGETGIALNISYGVGSASGIIVSGPVRLGDFFVPEQGQYYAIFLFVIYPIF